MFKVTYPAKNINFYLILSILWLGLMVFHLILGSNDYYFTVFTALQALFMGVMYFRHKRKNYFEIDATEIRILGNWGYKRFPLSEVESLRVNGIGDLAFMHKGKEVVVDLGFLTPAQKTELKAFISQ